MKKISFFGVGLVTCVALAGCQSTNTATGTNTGTGVAANMAATNTGVAGVNKPLLEALQTKNPGLSRTVLADLPPSGSADYSGYAQIFGDGAVIPTTTKEVVGVAKLNVGFAGSGSMTGTVTDFDDSTGTYTGTLNVTGGSIAAGANGPEVTSAIEGQLTRSSGEVFDVSGNLTGGFLGATGEYLNGANKVTVTSGGQSAVTDLTLNAERD
jgi:hypothetical protein